MEKKGGFCVGEERRPKLAKLNEYRGKHDTIITREEEKDDISCGGVDGDWGK